MLPVKKSSKVNESEDDFHTGCRNANQIQSTTVLLRIMQARTINQTQKFSFLIKSGGLQKMLTDVIRTCFYKLSFK